MGFSFALKSYQDTSPRLAILKLDSMVRAVALVSYLLKKSRAFPHGAKGRATGTFWFDPWVRGTSRLGSVWSKLGLATKVAAGFGIERRDLF